MSKENNRFQIICEEKHGMTSHSRVLCDKETGVQYFYHSWGYGGGLTPLLDKDGKPVINTQAK